MGSHARGKIKCAISGCASRHSARARRARPHNARVSAKWRPGVRDGRGSCCGENSLGGGHRSALLTSGSMRIMGMPRRMRRREHLPTSRLPGVCVARNQSALALLRWHGRGAGMAHARPYAGWAAISWRAMKMCRHRQCNRPKGTRSGCWQRH